MFDIARLNTRIEIQAIRTDRDAYSELTYGYETVAKRWAEVTPVKTGETFLIDQEQQKSEYKIRIRADLFTRTMIDAMRIILPSARYGDRVLRIIGMPTIDAKYNDIVLINCVEFKGDDNKI